MANDANTATDADKKKWPAEIGKNEDLYAVVDEKNGDVEYLVFTSIEKQATLVRDNGSWVPVSDEFIDSIDDPDLYNEFVDLSFIDYYDEKEKSGKPIPFNKKPMTAAADECPPATQDISVNLRNREKAITAAGYGPLNPKEKNDKFWKVKAERWSVSANEAKKSLCGNCVMFIVTSKMKDCIASGLEQGGSSETNAWDAIDAAELGYCEAFDFKCAASRTCDAWVTGGPISDDIKSNRGVV